MKTSNLISAALIGLLAGLAFGAGGDIRRGVIAGVIAAIGGFLLVRLFAYAKYDAARKTAEEMRKQLREKEKQKS